MIGDDTEFQVLCVCLFRHPDMFSKCKYSRLERATGAPDTGTEKDCGGAMGERANPNYSRGPE